MRTPTYTNEDIATAYHTLRQSNAVVNANQVKKFLGGGNPIRIREVIEELAANAAEAQVVAERIRVEELIPDRIACRLDKAFSSLIGEVQSCTSDLIAEIHEEHSRQLSLQKRDHDRIVTDLRIQLEKAESDAEETWALLEEAEETNDAWQAWAASLDGDEPTTDVFEGPAPAPSAPSKSVQGAVDVAARRSPNQPLKRTHPKRPPGNPIVRKPRRQ